MTIEHVQQSRREKGSLLRSGRLRSGIQTLILILPSLFWLVVFFAVPLIIVFIYSFLKRGPYGQIVWEFNLGNYARFFDPLYLNVFVRSFKIAGITTVVSFLLGYPVAYWIATQPVKRRTILLLLLNHSVLDELPGAHVRLGVLILRDSGLINNALIGLGIIQDPLPLFGTDLAIIIGLVYGWVSGHGAAVLRIDRAAGFLAGGSRPRPVRE